MKPGDGAAHTVHPKVEEDADCRGPAPHHLIDGHLETDLRARALHARKNRAQGPSFFVLAQSRDEQIGESANRERNEEGQLAKKAFWIRCFAADVNIDFSEMTADRKLRCQIP
jgi:hypothetical protein